MFSFTLDITEISFLRFLLSWGSLVDGANNICSHKKSINLELNCIKSELVTNEHPQLIISKCNTISKEEKESEDNDNP